MSSEKSTQIKLRLHSRNKNRERYDLKALIKSNPDLGNFVKPNKYGDDSVDFSNPLTVKILNKALLNHYYGIKFWEFPDKNLCPPIPGRADYIHHIADLLSEFNYGKITTGDKVTCLDVGVGASCIYPIIGVIEYNWNFIGSDINKKSIDSAQNIVQSNPQLKGKIECRHQEDSSNVFYGVIDRSGKLDLTICNPPFHSSIEDAEKGTKRKIKNLSGKRVETADLAGINNELICEGGESMFINEMVRESIKFSKNIFLFSVLVSKQSNLKGIYKSLEKYRVSEFKTVQMGTGNKSTRIVAWTFLSKEEQKEWRETKWQNR